MVSDDTVLRTEDREVLEVSLERWRKVVFKFEELSREQRIYRGRR